jgi:hypothetical protein
MILESIRTLLLCLPAQIMNGLRSAPGGGTMG